MGIQALPQATVRVLGASQVLTDPAAVVKELVDNALDARATSISVEIHNNTLDLIQVRDSGHGIPPGDRHLVARPHCTSKISSEADLEHIGGSSLGFRGEALASIAEMSGSLTISTRVEGEKVATSLKINQQGEIIGQERASTPVGTTIKITDFIKSNPVRRQVAFKSAEKTLKRIRQILQAYALARPQVRLSLRILKAKNDKGNWMYAPKPGGNAEDAAFKVFGSACASQCIWSVVEDRGFTIQAFLPRKDADKSKFSNVGPFISVDGRPMAPSRGTGKQVVKAFKLALQTANCNLHGCKDLFLFLNIQSESASYDANVEPAKDDVLFEDADAVIGVIGTLFAAVYPPEPAPSSVHMTEESLRPPVDTQSVGSGQLNTPIQHLSYEAGISLDQSLNHSNSTHISALLHSPEDGLLHCFSSPVEPDRLRNFRPNMYGCDEEDIDLFDARPPTGRTEAEMEEQQQIRRDIKLSNPWTMAKLNSSRRIPINESDFEIQVSPVPRIHLDANTYPTPRASSLTPPHTHQPKLSGLLPADVVAYNETVVDPYEQSPAVHSRQSELGSGIEHGIPPVPSPVTQPTYDYTLSSQSEPAGTPLSSIPIAGQRSPQRRLQQGQINKPFRPPWQQQPEREKVWFDHLENLEQRQYSPRKKQHAMTAGLVPQRELGDLVDDPRPLTPPRRNRDMRDFVTSVDPQPHKLNMTRIEQNDRPTASTRYDTGSRLTPRVVHTGQIQSTLPGLLGFVPANDISALQAHIDNQSDYTHHPAKRRRTSDCGILREISSYIAAADQIDVPQQAEGEGQTSTRRRKTADGVKVSRRKSSRLPLERTPAGQGTHELVLIIKTSVSAIRRRAADDSATESSLSWHQPPVDAHDSFATIEDPRVIGKLAATLEVLLVENVSQGEMVQDLSLLLTDALAERHCTQDSAGVL